MKGTALLAHQLQNNLFFLMCLLGLNISLRLLDTFFWKGSLINQYAIIPRQQFRLSRILLAPFLHFNRSHLASNMLPFTLLGGIAMFPNIQLFWLATMIIIIVDGLGIWIFGQKGPHLGASGLVLGYFGFLLTRGIFVLEPILIFTTLFIGITCR